MVGRLRCRRWRPQAASGAKVLQQSGYTTYALGKWDHTPLWEVPFMMFWAPGAVHAPHHAPQVDLDHYRGKFDLGWDAAREAILANQVARGVFPEGTQLAARPADIAAWDSLAPAQQRMYARQMEAFAAQMTHVDREIGRMVATLERTGMLEDTLIMITSDNGASGEGGLEGDRQPLPRRLGNGGEHAAAADAEEEGLEVVGARVSVYRVAYGARWLEPHASLRHAVRRRLAIDQPPRGDLAISWRMRCLAGAIGLLCLAASAGAECGAGVEGRPRIGLALAGGGAKGAAHVGVLQVLEELRVPVDCIAGTSMGSIIGGLYAAGLAPSELQATLESVDWADVMEDAPGRRELTFRRREDQQRYLLGLELGVGKGGLKLPSGLRSGQKLFLLLEEFTLPVAGIQDFARLPIPFRAVATDIQSGEMVVLERGDLAWAMRASMAIPSVFTPVTLDGRLLVDGGVTRNVPVDVVREMGADVVIAVDLGAPLSEREVTNVLQVYAQLQRMLTRTNMEPQLAAADLVVHPAVAQYGTLDFGEIAAISQAGVEEARARAAELARFAVSEEEYARFQERHRPPEAALPVVGEVRLEGNARVDRRAILSEVHERPGETFEPEGAAQDARRVFGMGDFEQVYFSLDRSGEEPALVYHLREKPWGPNYLHFGFSLDYDFEGDTNVELLTNLTATRLNARGAEWRNDLELGDELGVFSEFYQPLGFSGGWFVAPRLEWITRQVGVFDGDDRVAEVDARRLSARVDLGYQFGRWGEARLGVQRSRVEAELATGVLPPEIDPTVLEGADLGAVVGEFTIDRLDSVTFPREGGIVRFVGFFSADQIGAEAKYDKLQLALGQFVSRGRHTGFGTLGGGWSPGSELPLYDEFRIGGLFSLSGFAPEQLRGQYFGIARLGYYRKTRGSLYLGGWLEGGNVWPTSDAVGDDLIATATLLAGADSKLGPVYLAYGVTDTNEDAIYLVIGRTFQRR